MEKYDLNIFWTSGPLIERMVKRWTIGLEQDIVILFMRARYGILGFQVTTIAAPQVSLLYARQGQRR